MKAYLAEKANKWQQTNEEEQRHQVKLKTLLHCNDPRKSCAKNMMIGIFFDGTGNSYYKDYPKTHSNIARLYSLHSDNRKNGFHSIYLQGVGTKFKEIDDEGGSRGSGFGNEGMKRINFAYIELLNRVAQHFGISGSMFVFTDLLKKGVENLSKHSQETIRVGRGVRSKEDVDRLKALVAKFQQQNFMADINNNFLTANTIQPLLNQLNQAIGNRKPILGTINISVFGFSRGAAEARTFLNRFDTVFAGRKIAGYPVNIYFAGLFDTVSSVGIADIMNTGASAMDGFYSWAKYPHLNKNHVKECYHFVALNEVRSCFPLTSLKGFPQYAYPGAHSDVGGGYGQNYQGKTDISGVCGRHMYFLARKAGVPLVGLKNAASGMAKLSATAFLPNETIDKAFDGFIGEMAKNGFAVGKEHDLVKMAEFAHKEYIKHRGYILNDIETRAFYQRSTSYKQKRYLSDVNNHVKEVLDRHSANYKKYQLQYESLRKEQKSLKLPPFISEQRYWSLQRPLTQLVKDWRGKRVGPPLHAFYSDYVHDSVASFIEMGELFGFPVSVTREYRWNGLGILKYRTIHDK